jgi:NitT/TauT family transport system ATP-binding protein
MSSRVMLAVRNLSKSYQNNELVIDRLSIDILPGERVALFAPSGAGKTTLIKILAGLEKKTAGEVTISDSEPLVLFQEPRLFSYMSVEENIRLPWKIRRQQWSRKTDDEFAQWLEVCDLNASRKKYPYQLSGGMRQKVAIVRGFLQHPRLALMDEPFNSIGIESRTQIIRHICSKNPDLTLLLATHNLEEISMLTNMVLYFSSSRLEFPVKLDSEAFVKKFLSLSTLAIKPGASNLGPKRRNNDYLSQFTSL